MTLQWRPREWRPRALLMASAIVLNLGACREPSAPAAATLKTNVLLITVDTLRADALGSYGAGAAASTPTLDRLAAAGSRFTNAHAHNVLTLPSHANILSGLNPHRHGVRDNAGFRFPADRATLATILKAAGYRTGAFVSAFPLAARFGLQRGFDVYDDSFVDTRVRQGLQELERPGAQTVERARRFIGSTNGDPWFVWVHVYEPHYPYESYEQDVAAADKALAPLIDEALRRREGAAPILVVATSDHGESLGEHGEATHGILAYEATLRVPLIVEGVAGTRPSVIGSPARHVDLLPTILESIGIAVPSNLDGRSLLSEIRSGKDQPPVPTYFEALSGSLNRGWAPLRGVIVGGTKYIDLPIPEVYDLGADAGESRNLASASSVKPLRAALDGLRGDDRFSTVEVTGETRERLRALGYIGAGATPVNHSRYTDADDPKKLMALDARLQKIATLEAAGSMGAAVEEAAGLIRQRPSMAVSHLYMAHLQRRSGNLAGAARSLRTAARLNPRDTATAATLAAVLTQMGDARGALAALREFAAMEPPDEDVLLAQALALARLQRFDEALSALTRAAGGAPPGARIRVQEGTILLMAGREAEARRAFEHAIAVRPDAARAHTSLALMDAEAGSLDAAIRHWQAAVDADASERRTIAATAAILRRAGRLREAEAAMSFAGR